MAPDPRPRTRLQPHWALAAYLICLAAAAWSGLRAGPPPRPASPSDAAAALCGFYAFLLLSVVNYRFQFLPVGRLVLLVSAFSSAAASLRAFRLLAMALGSPLHREATAAAILDPDGGTGRLAVPLACATLAFVVLTLLLTRVRPRSDRFQSPSVFAVDSVPLAPGARPERLAAPAAAPAPASAAAKPAPRPGAVRDPASPESPPEGRPAAARPSASEAKAPPKHRPAAPHGGPLPDQRAADPKSPDPRSQSAERPPGKASAGPKAQEGSPARPKSAGGRVLDRKSPGNAVDPAADRPPGRPPEPGQARKPGGPGGEGSGGTGGGSNAA